MFQRIRQMLRKEFIQVLRDPRMRMVTFVIPCVQTIIICYAVNLDVTNIRTAVQDMDRSVASRDLVARFASSGYFDIRNYAQSDEDARFLLDSGKAIAVLRILPGYAEDLGEGRTASLQLLLDGTDSNTASIVLGYATQIMGSLSNQILVERYARKTGARREPAVVELRTRAWFNENLESRKYFVPGVIVVVVTLVTLLLTSMAVVREKEIGTMEQIIVSPITSVEFILGKTIPFAIIGFIDVTIVTLVGTFWFDVPIRGSLSLLYLATALYLLTTLSVGLFISTVSETQQQAMMSTFFFFFPAMLLSGFAFPIDNMPTVVQWLTVVNPMRYYLVIIRAIFLKGVGAAVLWPELLALTLLGGTMLSLVLTRFHKTNA
jgi:ABC-2 type transport system permease protein